MPLFITCLVLAAADLSSPPMVSAEAPTEKPSDVETFRVAALATASVGTSTTTGFEALFGGRAEVDVFRLGFNFTYGRSASLLTGLSDTTELVGLAGWSLMANRWGRIRVLGGFDLRTSSTAFAAGPAFSANARVGLSMLQLDVSSTLTPLPFRRLEARAALVLKGFLFELHGGYQATWLDETSTGSLATLFSNAPTAGPYLAFGVAL